MPVKRDQVDRSAYKAGRRLLSIALTALAAVLVGMVVWPTARKHYHAARIDSDDPAVRARALEAVLPHAVTDAALRNRLLDVLARLARDDADGVGPRQARAAAGWLFRNVPAFAELAESRLKPAGDDTFADLARLMILGGRWEVASRPVGQRARWLTVRYRTTEGDDRADVVRSMAALGPPVAPLLRSILRRALSDPSAQVRRAAIASTAVVLGETGTGLLIAATDDPEPPNRREAILMIAASDARPAAWQAVTHRLWDPDAAVREAAAWATWSRTAPDRPDPKTHRRLIEMLGKDPPMQVRAMAGLAVRDNRCLIDPLQHSEDVAVRARCCSSLRPPLARKHWDVLLALVESERKYWVALAAAAAAGRCRPSTASQSATRPRPERPPGPVAQRIRHVLVARLQQALRHGEDDLAAACVRSLGELADPAVTPLLHDVAAKLSGRPWVSFAAAQALAQVDPTGGGAVLLEMLEARHSSVRDLAAFELARLPERARPRARLRAALRSPDPAVRAGSVLAIALMHRQARESDAELLRYLHQRTDPEGRLFETRLSVRGYYLCGQFLLGDASVLRRIQSLSAAGRLSPAAACLSMLAAGEPAALDGPLLDNARMRPGFDARTFLCDHRFGEVLAHYRSDAPRIDWRTDPELQAWQIDRLREWWLVHRADRR